MRRLPLRHLMLVAALVLTPAASAHAAAVYWTNAAGGNWNVASNWSTAALPTASDTAVIDLPGTYAVTMNVNVTLAGLRPAPNPSAGKVRMAVDLARAQRLELSVFDVTGRRVAVIHDGILPAGRHSFEWGGASAGAAAPRPGVYLVRMSASDRTQVARIVRVE